MKDYKNKKTAGLVTLVKEDAPLEGGGTSSRYLLKSKRFSRDTGELEGEEEREVSINELEKQKAHLLKEIEGIDELINDINKL